MKEKVIAIVGPTASGKTKLSVEIAQKNNGEIISADSRLVYKGFDIAAAKPTLDEREGIPHYLIDIVEPEYDYSVAEYADMAKIEINNIIKKGKTPIIVGGTGLYIRVLLENYDIPRVEANYDLRSELEEKDTNELLNILKDFDYKSYENLLNSNKRRIIRAIEIIKTLGKPLSELEREKEPEYNVQWIIPNLESREWLYERINKRVDIMLTSGLVEETVSLLNKHGRIKNIIDTIGYKEMIEYLDGKVSLDEAAEKLKQHTRNYAKRQLTWFRKNPNLKINI
ncbi:tRNA (adenosine(37)-N6)-dimethylallyltransferase MiaA [bacterium]|nr:tRNA (adenosine(37)-N6)-dimethylallyltransferase MiaA [bacterium]